MNYCCKDFTDAIEDEDVEHVADQYTVRGVPNIVDDGDGYYDDMTSRLTIYYCPFCGRKLEDL